MFTVSTYVAESQIHGLGVFAAAPIAQGAVVWKLDPRVDLFFSVDQFEALAAALPSRHASLFRAWCYRHAGCYVLCGDNAKFANHSSTPNCLSIPALTDSGDVALRDISAGEEITYNYRLISDTDNNLDF